MSLFPTTLETLVEKFASLPGIGMKSAQRLAFHILALSDDEAMSFANAVIAAKKNVHCCTVCQNLTDTEVCSICTSVSRDEGVICVVTDPKDVAAIEATHEFRGKYHVLHGVISPMKGIGPDKLTVKDLLSRLDGTVKEVIIATDPTPEGETTAMYLSRLISPLGVKVSRIANGMPVGGDLEYADEITLRRAIEGRYNLE